MLPCSIASAASLQIESIRRAWKPKGSAGPSASPTNIPNSSPVPE
jgi:hypothetical protein